MTAYIDMSEVEKLAHNLDMSVSLVEGVADSALAHAAEMVEERAKAAAPTLTGQLKENISAHKMATGQGLVWAITSAAPYSAYVEFGTHRQAPQPYMIPAADAAGEELEQSLLRMIQPFR